MKFLIKITTFLTLLNSASAQTTQNIVVPRGTTASFECVGCEVEIRNPAPTAAVDFFDWALGIEGVYLSASNGGPSAGAVEFQASFNLHMGGPAWWKFKFGPGFDMDGEATHATLSEFAGPSFETTSWLDIDIGVAHIASFGRDGGAVNVVGGELGFGFSLWKGLKLDIGAGAGYGLFPTVRTERVPDWEKSEVQITSIQETGDGFTWWCSLGLGWWF